MDKINALFTENREFVCVAPSRRGRGGKRASKSTVIVARPKSKRIKRDLTKYGNKKAQKKLESDMESDDEMDEFEEITIVEEDIKVEMKRLDDDSNEEKYNVRHSTNPLSIEDNEKLSNTNDEEKVSKKVLTEEEEMKREISQKLKKGLFKFQDKHGRSNAWRIFAEVIDENGVPLENIVACRKCFSVRRYKMCTTNLIKHKCFKDHILNQSDGSHSDVVVNSFTKKQVVDAVARWTIENCRPFQIITDSGLREMASLFITIGSKFGEHVNIDECIPHPTKVVRNIEELYQKHINNINHDMAEIKSNGYSISSDVWTELFLKTSYVAVSVNYIHDCQLNCRVLAMPSISGESCTGAQIRRTVERILLQFGLQLDNTIIVTDNGSNMIEAFANNDQICCICQLLNDIVGETFRENPQLSEVLTKSSKLVKYIKDCRDNSNLTSSLQSYCPARWKLIYNLFTSIKENWDDITTSLSEKNEQDRLKNLHLNDITAIANVLSAFKESLKTLESENQPTLHLVIPHLHRLKKISATHNDDSVLITKFKSHLQYALEKVVVPHITKLHKIALFLFPPSNQLHQFDESEKFITMDDCKTLMRIYGANSISEEANEQHNDTSDFNLDDVFSDFVRSSSQSSMESKIHRELNAYANTEVLFTTGFDVLKWWKANEVRFPLLYKVSCRVLATPASKTSSEKVLTKARNLINERRSGIGFNDSMINEIICLHFKS